MTVAALIINGPAPRILPAYPLPGHSREGRPLYVTERVIHLNTRHGWWRIPCGYVTDFGSIPAFATLLTLLHLQPLGRHAWAALAHDFGYAVGQPGMRPIFDDIFQERMEIDGVGPLGRAVMYRAVRLGGAGGYASAKTWWDTENFADPDTGEPHPPPFERQQAFIGQPYGLRPMPDWGEPHAVESVR